MANKNIGQLTAAGALTGAELLHIEQSGNSRRTTAAALAALVEVQASANGYVYVDDFYDGVHFLPRPPTGPLGASSISLRPLSGQYASLALAQVDYPVATSLNDEVDWCVWQMAVEAIYVRDVTAVGATTNVASGTIIANGTYIINKPILVYLMAAIIEGVNPNVGNRGTVVCRRGGTPGTVDEIDSIFYCGIQDEQYQPLADKLEGNGPLPKYIFRNMTIQSNYGGVNHTVAGEGSGFIVGLRVVGGAFCQFDNLGFFGNLYDGIVLTGAHLFVIIERCFFSGISRDGITQFAGPIAPSSNNSTTIWIYNNEFIGVGRYSMMLDMVGGAVEQKCIIEDNSFEHSQNNSFYYNNPEWYVGGVRAWLCIANAANTEFNRNRFEGSNYKLWGTLHLHACGANTIKDNNMGGGFIWSNGTSTGYRTQAALNFRMTPNPTTGLDYVLVAGVTKNNPGVVTTTVAHGFSDGDRVFFTHFTSGGGMLQLIYEKVTVTVIDSTHFSIGLDTTAYTTWVSGGRVWKGHNYYDITDARNYNLGYPGNIGTATLTDTIYAHNYNSSTIYLVEGYGTTNTSNFIVEDVVCTFWNIPTKNGTYARVIQNYDEAAPVMMNPSAMGGLMLRNINNLSPAGKRLFSWLQDGLMGAYQCHRTGVNTWLAISVYGPTFNDNLYVRNFLVRPVTPNGLFYQCVAGGTTGSSEPAWPITLGATVVDGTVTWTNVGKDFLVSENLLYESIQGGKRTRYACAAPSEGFFAVGDRIMFTGPTAGGFIGAVCTTATSANGTGTVWKNFGAISA